MLHMAYEQNSNNYIHVFDDARCSETGADIVCRSHLSLKQNGGL